MKLNFTLENQVNVFRVNGRLESTDLAVIRDSLFRFFESNPSYTVLDLSETIIDPTLNGLNTVLIEIQSCAQAQNLHFILARTQEEANLANQSVLELALQQQVAILQAKLELRQNMREQAEKLMEENAKLQASVASEMLRLKSLAPESTRLSPILEKLWSEK